MSMWSSKDILQLMIEASDDTRTNRETVVMRECPTCRPRDSRRHKLSAREILDNSLTLLFDETSKNTLAHVSYLLAINPEIQMKLQSEIDSFFEENPVSLFYCNYINITLSKGSFRKFCLRKTKFRKILFMKLLRRLTTLITLFKRHFVSIHLQRRM